MKKVIVIGCPGSGKSTFSRALHDLTGLPVFHLDMLYWNPDRTTVEKNIFYDRLNQVLLLDQWIIDGNYASTMELRLQFCDTVFFLDYPTDICLDGIHQRKGSVRSDLPWVETEDDREFITFIENFQNEGRPQILRLLEEFPGKEIYRFSDRAAADAFLSQLS